MPPRRMLLAAALLIALAAPAGGSPPPRIPDVAVVDQDGRRLHFYSDLVKGRTVVVNFIFTNCATICPTMGVNFGRLQDLVGGDVRLISISVDPDNDTPEALKAWSRRWKGGPRWTLITGSRADLETLRKAFAMYTPDAASHTAITLIVNDAAGSWTRVDGLAPAAKVAPAVKRIAEERAR